MKKLITLVLVLVLAFGLSVPAMAFTGDTCEDVDHPYDLSIYLVEYDDNDLFGLATLPKSDRGYAKNEIVAAIVELYVPEDEAVVFDNYTLFVIGGENVDLDITDNYVGGNMQLTTSSNIVTGVNTSIAWWDEDNSEIVYTVTDIGLKGEDTFRWLVFAKVTDDDASITAKLIDGEGVGEFEVIDPDYPDESSLILVLDGVTYYVIKNYDTVHDEYYYGIMIGNGDYPMAGFRLDVDEDYKTIGMSIRLDLEDDAEPWLALGVNTKNELGIVDPENSAKILTDGDDFDDVMDIYNDVVVDVFGLDYFKIGNYLRDSFFEDLVSADTIIATVDIAPFTAYVTVPDNIVVDPPKTGDAASIMGFVMVALSGAGGASALLLKKRG